jgi:zinc/manganese transport system substrate-binding protein
MTLIPESRSHRCGAVVTVVVVVVTLLLSNTFSVGAAGAAPTPLKVVAAENFWGSIVKQLAGSRASVSSIITNPETDPHSYEARPSDGRAIASAKYVVLNGIGYDPWAQKLLDANPDRSRKVLNVGDLVGVKEGGNPHQWYSVESVQRFITRVTSDLETLDPKNAAYYETQKRTFETKGLVSYHALIAEIKQKYAGTPVGASESIFTPLAETLGLKLLTPETFLDAIAEGTDPTARDKATVDSQVQKKQIKIFVYNSQNSTPDVQAIVKAARAKGIPISTVTETLVPAAATFQGWQTKQLKALQKALAKATGS